MTSHIYNLALRFARVSSDHAAKTALIIAADGSSVTYGELSRLANRMSRFLLSRRVAARDVVCISMEKCVAAYAAIIGCLNIGAPYAVLDPETPNERLNKIIARCKPTLLLAAGETVAHLSRCELGDAMLVDCSSAEFDRALNSCGDAELAEAAGVTGEHPAYIMFTSGSTGFPKGAVMTHQNVLNFIAWNVATFELRAEDVLSNVNPLYFDNSVFDIYSSLFTGATLAAFSKDMVTDPRALLDGIERIGCTSWFSVPSLLIFLQTMKALRPDTFGPIRRIVFGGEGYPRSKLRELYRLYGGRSAFFNVYGPTECTCMCSAYRINDRDFEDLQGFPPLGAIADNFSYLILDDRNERAAPGASGELCLLGPNVGKGYYNDPERTRAQFVQNPLNNAFSEVMYRTGDIVRCDARDGKLHIMGRKDNQIKHMGYRIELEEIETALSCLDYVAQAAVVHGTVGGFSRIVAVLSVTTAPCADVVRNDLKRYLPEYMIPERYYFETELPKNQNGKVDRRALAERYLKH